MKASKADHRRVEKVTRARLARKWLVVGLRGQQVGTAESCVIDLDSGRIKYLLLTTPWQTLKVPWQSVSVDAEHERFQLLSARSGLRAPRHDSSA